MSGEGRGEEEALSRLRRAWFGLPELYREIGGRIRPLAGDFLKQDLGLSGEVISALSGNLSLIFHLGAQTGIQKSREELMRVNLEGTRNVLSFAERVNLGGSLKRFVYVSTAYTAGRRRGRILETDPPAEEFSTYYEESKALGERVVSQSGLAYTIARPGMIVGNSGNGRIREFNTVYYVLKLLLQGRLRVLPISREQRLNLVPVDYVAESIVRLAFDPRGERACFHLTAPEAEQPRAGELSDLVCDWAQEHLRLSLKRPLFLPLPLTERVGLWHNQRKEEKEKNRLSNLTALLSYFHDRHQFDSSQAEELLGAYPLHWRDYMGKLLEFACRQNFLHLTERNVFEQVLYRLESRSAPITYFDVGEKGLVETSAGQMRQKILDYRRALAYLGVQRGDRVALTGINSTDYFALDIAIGLCAGVSVPIYYTAPIGEIDLLLERSGAKWFFVGDERIMKQIPSLKRQVVVIAFSGGESFLKKMNPGDGFFGEGKSLRTLEEPDFVRGCEAGELQNRHPNRIDKVGILFLKEVAEKAAGMAPPLPSAGMEPEELATIRYTSGTTGEPKGVMFQAGQLSWMGQVLTNLLPWKEKQEEMRYLSFLPLSHVVEGILASYAPYYVHCPVKYYYLNDFQGLTKALPRVRPTVFFSVPRFYEKLWQQVGENPVGKAYLEAGEGPFMRALGGVLKRAVLRKAGLDHCSQLIVGSAPISEELLLRLRGLGIEVHNAYGQTEAPLITINRLGDNRIPSIGTPLPDTKVWVAKDGELIVEGPQVCLGYYGLSTDNIQEGVLKSGDLGWADEEGHIYLIGRKKEMVVTSYGKNINCPKIEERLKDIPGISQAMLIGEGRPYCTALLWAQEKADLSDLPAMIERMNQGLSHPETIRRWTVMETSLSIGRGELTPNLKVKRSVVQEHYREEIEKMYASGSTMRED